MLVMIIWSPLMESQRDYDGMRDISKSEIFFIKSEVDLDRSNTAGRLTRVFTYAHDSINGVGGTGLSKTRESKARVQISAGFDKHSPRTPCRRVDKPGRKNGDFFFRREK